MSESQNPTPETEAELVIDESNFHEYFFDARKHKPQRGQILACYRAAADLVDGPEKRSLIDLLAKTDKAEAASNIMRKALNAIDREALRVVREMTEDLLGGMTPDEVAAKPYRYTFEMHFYTQKEHLPKGDPHWSSVSLLHVNSDAKITLEQAPQDEQREADEWLAEVVKANENNNAAG